MSFKKVAIIAARKAGKILSRRFGSNNHVRVKPNKSLVSSADIEANNAILKIIKEYYPKHSIISEESKPEDNNSDYKWLIDPLDGTHNFIHKIPIFGTSIALEYKKEVILGVIYMPLQKMMLVAEKGKGAFLNGKKIRVSQKKEIEHSFLLFELSLSNRLGKISFLEKFAHITLDLRNFGCAVYHLLLMATGKADGFVIFRTHEWDIAAGFLIVEEAGGKVTNLQGGKWTPYDKEYVVSNGKLHKELLEYAGQHK